MHAGILVLSHLKNVPKCSDSIIQGNEKMLHLKKRSTRIGNYPQGDLRI